MSQAAAICTDRVFRFFDLPAELREAVYKHLFHRSRIDVILKYKQRFTHRHMRKTSVSPEHYPWSINLASRAIRADSVSLLDANTSLHLRGRCYEWHDIPQFLSSVSPQALRRIQTVLIITSSVWPLENDLARLLTLLPGMKRLNFGVSTIHESTKDGSLRLLLSSRVEVDGQDEATQDELDAVVCHETFKDFVKNTAIHMIEYDQVTQLSLCTTVISTLSNEEESPDRKYGLVTFDGATFASRDLSWDELYERNYEEFDRSMKNGRE